MSNSIQTNVDSIIAQNNLQANNASESNTIQQLTSGYRINSSADDAAGLAVANQFRSDVAELNQGVRNANDGISALQIVDGGLTNISQMLDREKTLATQAASDTFSGDRGTLNQEYQTLLGEIDRQADNIGLGAGSTGARYSTNIGVYIGGSDGVQTNAIVNVNLKGAQVNSAGLGILSTNILGGNGTDLTGGTNLNTAGPFLANSATETLTVRTVNSAGKQTTNNVVLTGTTAGLSGTDVLNQVNSQLYGSGVNAAIDTNGKLEFFGGNNAFSIDVGAASAGTGVATAAATNLTSANMYTLTPTSATATAAGVFNFSVNGNSINVNIASGDTVAQQADAINQAMSAYGIQAVMNSAGTQFSLQGTQSFTLTDQSGTPIITAGAGLATAPATTSSNTANANAAIAALSAAVTNLGLVQGKVGTGQNQLQYAVDLANSQISSFSAAESRIRDADVAADASKLSQAQVLQQSSVAALAQANQEPQALLSLIKNA